MAAARGMVTEAAPADPDAEGPGCYVRLYYLSRAAGAPLSPEQWETLAAAWAQSNIVSGIGSALWVAGTAVYQALEGPAAAVERALARLRADERLGPLAVLGHAAVATRQWPLGLRLHVLGGEEALEVPRAMLEGLARHYDTLRRFCTEPLQDQVEGAPGRQGEAQAMPQAVVAVRLLAFEEVQRCAARGDPAAAPAACGALTRLVNAFTNAVMEVAALRGGRVVGMRGDTLYVTFPAGAVDEAVAAACDMVDRLDDVRHLALRGDVCRLLFGAAAVVGVDSVTAEVSPVPDQAQQILIGGVPTLCQWVLEACLALGYSVLLTEDVQRQLGPGLGADLRPCGAHHLGRRAADGELPAAPADVRCRLYTPSDRNPYLVPQSILADVERYGAVLFPPGNSGQCVGAGGTGSPPLSPTERHGRFTRRPTTPPPLLAAHPLCVPRPPDSIAGFLADASFRTPVSQYGCLSPLPVAADSPSSVSRTAKLKSGKRATARDPLLAEEVLFPVSPEELRAVWEHLGGTEGGHVPLDAVRELYRGYVMLEGRDLLEAVNLQHSRFELYRGDRLAYDSFCTLVLRLAQL